MIVKDEEKNLKRCLDSLQILLEKSFIELIIVDTGSRDNTVEIAKKYTNSVFFHEWNGNFSDMRNISISYAKGEWIFIIDADEELETPNLLFELIFSKKINDFKTVRIQEKNLLSIKRNKYVYHTQERLFKNDGEFHYEGTIHNQPRYQHPVLTVKDIWLMHYGYINEDKQLMEKKFERTATMLKKELEKNPEQVYYRFQLARSYMMHGEGDIALEEISKAYDSMKKQDKRLIPHRYYVFGEYARMALNKSNYKKTIEVCLEGLTHTKQYIDLYYYMAHSYFSLLEYEKGIETVRKYIEYYIKYNDGTLDLSNFTAVEMYTVDKAAYERTLERVISLIYQETELSNHLKYFGDLLHDLENERLKAKLLTKFFLIENNYDDLIELYLSIDEKNRYGFIHYLENLLKKFTGDREQVLKKLSALNDDYGLVNHIRITNSNYSKLLTELLKQDLMKFPDKIIVEIALLCIQYNYLNRLFKKIDSGSIKKIVKVLIDEENKKEHFIESLNKDFNFNDFQNNRIYMAIANVILLSEVEEDATDYKDSVIEIFNKYLIKGQEYITYLYNINHIRLTYTTLINKEEKFLALIYLAKKALKINKIESHNKYILEAAVEYPYLSSLLRELTRKNLNVNNVRMNDTDEN